MRSTQPRERQGTLGSGWQSAVDRSTTRPSDTETYRGAPSSYLSVKPQRILTLFSVVTQGKHGVAVKDHHTAPTLVLVVVVVCPIPEVVSRMQIPPDLD
jgi:hypothetical protein